MKSSQFDELQMLTRTRLALWLTGWRRPRFGSDIAFETSLEKMGYAVIPAAKELLREFCGIAIGYDSWRWKRFLLFWVSVNQFWIGVLDSDSLFDETMDQFRGPSLQMEEYRRRIGFNVTPVGGIPNRRLYILVGANHALYAVGEQRIWLIGKSTIGALNRLVYDWNFLQEVD